jgi:diaminopimelate epimerase
MASALVGPDRAAVRFWKMTGSGNDFVFLNGIHDPTIVDRATDPVFIRRVCALHTGVGADGVAVIQVSNTQDFTLSYFNRNGSEGELCGNASLCATRLAVDLGIARPEAIHFDTRAGVISARMVAGSPHIDLQPVCGLRPDAGITRQGGEHALGFIDSGVPHLVIRTDDLGEAPVLHRGPELRFHPSLPAGANVNWVSRDHDGGWTMRTYERGVEGETLACGTGAVACAALLQAWGESGETTRLRTKSGQHLTVQLTRTADGIRPQLSGEGRIVFEGLLREL